jgi:formylmethanofuran dehydrogenase subunit E
MKKQNTTSEKHKLNRKCSKCNKPIAYNNKKFPKEILFCFECIMEVE